MVKVGKSALMHKKWTLRVELTKKTSHCKSRDFLRKRRLKTIPSTIHLRYVLFPTNLNKLKKHLKDQKRKILLVLEAELDEMLAI